MKIASRAKSVVARVLLLKRFPMFTDLSPAALKSLAERIEEIDFVPGEALLSAGETAARVHFLLSGEVEVCLGRETATFGGCAVVGDIDVLAATPFASRDARAAAATQTLSIDRAGLLAAQEDCFPLQRAMLKHVGGADLEMRRRLGWIRVYDGRPDDAMSEQIPEDGAERLELAHRVFWLRSTRELCGLRIRTLGRLAATSELVAVPAGEPVWRRDDAADFAVQVLRGNLRCEVADGPPFSVGSETLLGLSEALAEESRWCDAVAASEVLTLRLGIEDILDELEDDTDVANELMTALAADVAELEEAATSRTAGVGGAS